jgi:peptide chain release factor 1
MNNPYQDQIDHLQQKIQENREFLMDLELGQLATSEISNLEAQLAELLSASAQYENTQDESSEMAGVDHKVNCLVEFRQGTGGDEAKIWADELLRMYLRFAEQIQLKIEFVDDMVIKIKGKTTIFPLLNKPSESSISAYELFKYESGVHRVQRVPVTEAQGRIHTSTASVAVLPEVPKTAIAVREEDLEWQFMRSGGAGGQSVNKTNSAVRLIHKPSGIAVTARQERKQAQNREIALELLRSQLWEIEEEKRLATIGNARIAIGRAQRSEKIRTYNFPQNRITDHRTKQSWYDLETIMAGNMSDLMNELHPELEKLYAV